MQPIAFSDITNEIGSSIRTHFIEQLKRRTDIVNVFRTRSLEMRDYIIDNWDEVRSLRPYLFIECVGFAFPLRIKDETFQWIADYDPSHLRNSIISQIILKDTGDMKSRLDKMLYLFYYYWFMKKDISIDNLTLSACFELQEIIKELINKELTLYRAYSTAPIIDAIRWRLTSENLLLLPRASNINMRKL